MKKFVFLIGAVTAAILLTVGVSADWDGTKRLFDDANVVDSQSEEVLEEYLYLAAKESGLNVAAVVSDNVGDNKSDRAVIDYADLYYEKLYGKDTDGILLLINNDTQYDWISTSGQGIRIFTDARIDAIFDDFGTNLKYQNYSEVVMTFSSDVIMYSKLGVPVNQYNESTEFGGMLIEYVFSGGFLFVLVFALIITFAVYGGISSGYKIKKATTSSYLNKASIFYTQQTDTFIREYTTRTRISSSSSGGGHRSSGRSSTHRSSSGGSHGGGGRHR